MRVLVLHSDVAEDAPPDEQDTLATVDAVVTALAGNGYIVTKAAFHPDELALDRVIQKSQPNVVFNLVESVRGRGDLAHLAPRMLAKRRLAYTGCTERVLQICANKPICKEFFLRIGVPTPDWSTPSSWQGLANDKPYVVKSANEDASIGLDDEAVVTGITAVKRRARECAARYGGRWFAEAYMPGREFNVSLLAADKTLLVLPIAETRFENWAQDRPRVVGYSAKWHNESLDSINTARAFGIEKEIPELGSRMAALARRALQHLDTRGYARVDFRLDAEGAPSILEINPNPCLEPQAGFAAAAAEAQINYPDLVERIVQEALRSAGG
jgi:D-alanine-D-alanine ligase